jgi:choline dehydrogenase-like flavoprotein
MDRLSHPWFHATVSALAYSLAQAHAENPKLKLPFNDLTRFILEQHARMPDYLGFPMAAATLGFDLFGVLSGARPFHSQAPDLRARQIASWRDSKLSFQRDLIRYYESLALLALYSRPGLLVRQEPDGVLDAAGHATPPPLPTSGGSGIVIDLPQAEVRAQIIVVGSGPGGAITACLLAEAGRDVVLVEEGPFLSLNSCAAFSKDEMQQKYRNGGQTVALGKNKIAYVEGCCVGGGSEINSGLYHRTPPEMLDRWRKEFQVDALTEKVLTPHFEACEQDVSVSLLPGPPPTASLKLHEGATRLGWKSLEVPRWFRYSPEGAGQRQSMSETFVPRFLRAGGKLLPNTRALRLRQEGGRWIIQARHRQGGPLRLVAESLFLCAGAVHTPALLRRSGITRNVGNSLQVHPTVKIAARFKDEVNRADLGVPVHQVKEFAPRLSFGCSISSPPYLSLALIDHPEAAQQVAQAWQHQAIYYAMITSEGRGSVQALPGFRDPLVRYGLTVGDRRNLADGLRKLSQILFEAGATALYPSLTRGPVLRCTGCLDKIPEILPEGLANLMTIHLFSSCPMGEDKSRCAANSFGRVHGLDNLYLNDASLLCTAPGVNPQGSVMAIARRNTLNFLSR